MKFYYNGQLVRTSKTHAYKYAAIEHTENGFYTLKCSATAEGAQQGIEERVKFYLASVPQLRAVAEAIRNGKTTARYTRGGRSFTTTKYSKYFDWTDETTAEEMDKAADEIMARESDYRARCEVVELEAREK